MHREKQIRALLNDDEGACGYYWFMSLVSSSLRRQVRTLFLLAMLFVPGATAPAQSKNSAMPPPDETGISKSGLHYSIYGTGEPILAIHGLGGDMYSWREFVKPQ